MSDEYLDPISSATDQSPNKTTKIIIAVVVVVILCICLCLCVLLVTPMLLGPTIGNVFSDIEYQLMLTPLP